MLDDERSLWTVVVIGGFAASRGPAEKIIVPNRPAENAMVASNHVYPAFSGGFDPLTALGDDVAPDSVLATKADKDGNVLWTRPLYACPQKGMYRGAGDTKDSANYRCEWRSKDARCRRQERKWPSHWFS